MSQRNIPSPPMSVENEAFWAAANEGKLMIPRCKDTGQFFWYPRNLSPFTLSTPTRSCAGPIRNM